MIVVASLHRGRKPGSARASVLVAATALLAAALLLTWPAHHATVLAQTTSPAPDVTTTKDPVNVTDNDLCLREIKADFAFTSELCPEPTVSFVLNSDRYVLVIDLGATITRLIPYAISHRREGEVLPFPEPLLERHPGGAHNNTAPAELPVDPRDAPHLEIAYGFAQANDLVHIEAFAMCLVSLATSIFTKPVLNSNQVATLLYATSGMRMLPSINQDARMAKLRNILSSSGVILPNRFARVLSGSEEARYAWIHHNDRVFSSRHRVTVDNSDGIVDVGSGAVQLAFLVPNSLTRGESEAAFFTFNLHASGVANLYVSSMLFAGTITYKRNVRRCIARKMQMFFSDGLDDPDDRRKVIEACKFQAFSCVEPEVAFEHECEQHSYPEHCVFRRAPQPRFNEGSTFVITGIYNTTRDVLRHDDEHSHVNTDVCGNDERIIAVTSADFALMRERADAECDEFIEGVDEDNLDRCIEFMYVYELFIQFHLHSDKVTLCLQPPGIEAWARGAALSFLNTEFLEQTRGFSGHQVATYALVTFLAGCMIALLAHTYFTSRTRAKKSADFKELLHIVDEDDSLERLITSNTAV